MPLIKLPLTTLPPPGVDVFQDELSGLVLVDFEFKEVTDKNNFEMPDFCLSDVTQDKFFAGGMLCGKKYSDIEVHLGELGYKKID
jgi:CYTH domain-containing protein